MMFMGLDGVLGGDRHDEAASIYMGLDLLLCCVRDTLQRLTIGIVYLMHSNQYLPFLHIPTCQCSRLP